MKKNKQEAKNDKKKTATNILVNTDKKKRILFVDDDAAIRDALSIVFERAGYDFEMKDHVTDIIKNRYQVPDIFIIDKQLPGYNGLDLCQQLKGKTSTWHIPVIIVSASPDIETLSVRAGADDYIEKPFQIKLLVDMIRFYLQRKPGMEPIPAKSFRDIYPDSY